VAITSDRKEYHRQWYIKNREKRLAQTKAYQAAHKQEYSQRNLEYQQLHPEVRRRAQARYRATHVEEEKQRLREYYRNNLDKEKARNRLKRKIYYPANREKILEKNQVYHDLNSEKIKAQQKEYRKKNKQKRQEQNKRWRNSPKGKAKLRAYAEANRGRIVAYAQKRQALKIAAAVNLEQIQAWMESVRKKTTAICYYCRKRISSDRVHFDHIIALANGGPHSVANLCVSCDFCNLSKGAKPIRTWIQTGQGLLEL